MRLLERFDAWVARGPFTPLDLGVYRIVYASLMLVLVPNIGWLGGYPDSLYSPPPGPFQLFDGFPDPAVLTALEISSRVALAALLLGFRTTWASVATTLLLVAGAGFAYSLGKIDHTMFPVLAPTLLAFTRWGDTLSVDALLSRRAGGRAPRPTTGPVPQWPLRLFALAIGLGFLTAAWPKLSTGWLDPGTQAVEAVMARQYWVNERTDLLAPFFVELHSPLFWEPADQVAVLLEVVVVISVLHWRAYRSVLAVATIFHLGIMLMMNIDFWVNVLAYGAFVSWSALRLPPAPTRWLTAARGAAARAVTLPTVVGAVLVLGVGTWALAGASWWPAGVVGQLLVTAGAAAGAWYLVTRLLALRPRRRSSPEPGRLVRTGA